MKNRKEVERENFKKEVKEARLEKDVSRVYGHNAVYVMSVRAGSPSSGLLLPSERGWNYGCVFLVKQVYLTTRSD